MLIFAEDKDDLDHMIFQFMARQQKTVVISNNMSSFEVWTDIYQSEINKNLYILTPQDSTLARAIRPEHVIFINSQDMDSQVIHTIARSFAIVHSNPINKLKDINE